ncbi:hypothetical protein MPER_12653 [Moniliophthora perniciosa FA553]|nr:hypothetical protein MPER_12653 [Moniliophthora perniciosa FA553]
MICLGQFVKDISIGNILYSEVNGQIIARLGDLEYAKQVSVPSEPHRDVKTGTPHFIACEVERGKYLFQPDPAMPIDAQSVMYQGSGNTATTELNLPTVPFRFNYLHDLESVWWILVYFVFTKIPAGTRTKLSNEQFTVQRDTREVIFPHPLTSPERQEFITNALTRNLHLSILVNDFANAGGLVRTMGNFLCMQYRAVEAMPDFPAGGCFSGIHGRIRLGYFAQPLVDAVFNGLLEDLLPASPDGNPPATAAGDTPATGAKKRKMDETEEIVEGMSSLKKGRQVRR